MVKRESALEFVKPLGNITSVQFHKAVPVQAETTTQIADFAAKPLQTTTAQIIPATQELGQLLDETRSKTSDFKKKQRFAENILHMNPLE